MSWTLDHVGPLTSSVADMFNVMEVFLGEALLRHRTTDIRGLRIGVPKSYFNERLDEDVYRLYKSALSQFEDMGAILIDIDVPGASEAVPLTFTLAAAEAGYVHRERMENSMDLFGPDVKAVLQSSTSIPASSYIDALKQRQEITDGVSRLFDDVDVIIAPTLPTTPKEIGQEEVVIGGVKEDLFGCMIRYTCPFNLTGHPVLAVPCGIADDGLPVGIQIIGPHGREERLLKAGYAYEQAALGRFYEIRDERCV
ncbi:amidase [Alicyclobacillus cycloheptanicus]|nr:amidase [Alicyclobacillus cycloheptanicus]